jgi:peptide/nickel transport system substrate-binding protein
MEISAKIKEEKQMRKGPWLLSAALVSLILLLVSCGQSQTTSSTAPATTGAKTTAAGTTAAVTTKASDEKPKYGGIFTAAQASDTAAFCAAAQFDLFGFQISITNEALISTDWAKGPAGTGETDLMYSNQGQEHLQGGWLAESWEIPDNETIIWHIRQGAKWWDKPPANGREFTADDVVWNLNTQWANEGGNFNNFFPAPEEKLISATALDKYTVECKFHAGYQGIHFFEDGARAYMMLPELYPTQTEWKNALGTGAFMLTDYVSGTSMTMARNPNYWQVDPVGPGKGNQLPYIDGLKFLVIPDLSTRMVAFRTGKIDVLPAITWEDLPELESTMPYKFERAQTFGANPLPMGREDKELPFNDVRVRQAMNLAVDKVSILEDFYKGNGQLLGYPYRDAPSYSQFYTPLEELPENVQELVKGGNVPKAKQLLADAGYPNGFKTQIVCSSAGTDADFLSIIKEQLKQADIDMEIKVVEPGVFRSIERGRTFEEMIFKFDKQAHLPHYMFEFRPESNDCASYWDTPETRTVYETIRRYLAVDDAMWAKDLKDITPFILENSFAIWLPVSYKYNVWQPWLKNCYGAFTMNAFTPYHQTYYNWIDTDMKKSLGY